MLAAFAQLRPGTGEGVTGPDPIELWRFYVDHPWHGRGVAAQQLAAHHNEPHNKETLSCA